MASKKAKRTVESLTDDEIESSIDGSSDVSLIRNLLEDNQNENGFIYEMDFGQEFAEAIEGFIDATPKTKEWNVSWQENCLWGESIAENINKLLRKK